MTSQPDTKPAAASQLPPDLPPEVRTFLQEVGYLEPDHLKVGDAVPSVALTDLQSGETVWLGGPHLTRPTALIFGSYT
ncbi:MAG TPA: hypothetical protein VKU00_32100 [Chthonomonadaceae bacterium]|nr:hypothetical protein [Chthonomonadaceae bacterium]